VGEDRVSEPAYVQDSVATHLPVLDLVKRLVGVRKVLELGSGIYSTNKLLEFPGLESLLACEDSAEWFKKLLPVKDERLTYRLEADLAGLVWRLPLDEYDLIFIDSGATILARVPVMEAVAARHPRAIVLVHDFEELERECPAAMAQFDNRVVYLRQWPATGILWNQTEESGSVQNVAFDGVTGHLCVEGT
jgi:hypothetical protein